jgi:acetyl esterase/lipase
MNSPCQFKMLGLSLLVCSSAVAAVEPAPAAQAIKDFDAASAFGARPSVESLTLSPSGSSVAYLMPGSGQGSTLYTLDLAKGSRPRQVLSADGTSFRLSACRWIANDRLICYAHAYKKDPIYGMLPISRVLAIDADGKNPRELSNRTTFNSRGFSLFGGGVIDYLPEENGAVLMTRMYTPDDQLGTHLGSTAEGLGLDWIDTRTLAVKHVEPPRRETVGYVTDGHGTVRMMITQTVHAGEQNTGILVNLYRLPGSKEWQTLNEYHESDRSGFAAYAVDRDLNVAYGFMKKDGRQAVYSVALNGSGHAELVYARPDVDVDDMIEIGRHRHVVGTSYVIEARHAQFFAPAIADLMGALSKAFPHAAVTVAGASTDENKMLIFASSDVDPGVYYLMDRTTRHLDTFLVARSPLEGVKLANVKPVTYTASDGTAIPGYLTMPAGREDAKGLPALVLPHGGPNARDEWGFDWLSQFYASRGFAVLQPNFRGSFGYGDDWFKRNGFRSWRIAIGDVLDAGRWLVHEGIADPSRLAVLGWSYGGYAALQSAVTDPSVFKAVVAIAPVTDLSALKEDYRHWTDFEIVGDFIGDGPEMHEGSPAEHADKIKVPVILFHGSFDRNVSIEQSKRMTSRLTAAGGKCELVTWDNLDHQLDDSTARAQMLRKSDEFLRRSLGL